MNKKAHKRIYRKTRERNLTFQHVCEVGVYLPETSNIRDFIFDKVRATLVEADPQIIDKIHHYFKDGNIQVFPVAVWDHNGVLQLSKAEASTFATAIGQSPAIVNDRYHVETANTFEVPCKIFSEIDDGTIDLLSIDIEGGEWYVIKHMVSRPKVISVETHGKYYTNPFLSNITDWMEREGYRVWFRDQSDTVYVRAGLFEPDWGDRWSTWQADTSVRWKKFKGLVKGALKK